MAMNDLTMSAPSTRPNPSTSISTQGDVMGTRGISQKTSLCQIERLFRPLAVLAIAFSLLLSSSLRAEIAEPDHVIYGHPAADGLPLTEGQVTLMLEGDTQPIAIYAIGSDADGSACAPGEVSCYVLRVPMDFGTLRRPGTAREGEVAHIFVDGELSAEVVIGEAGSVQQLDLDTEFVPRIPTLSVLDTSGGENLAGPFGLEVAVTLHLSFPIESTVSVDWQTVDGSAVAGADYATASGVATILAGDTSTTLEVTIFDDAEPEADPTRQVVGESFSIQLTNASEANLLDAVGRVTILDDDTPPALTISNLSVVEPPSSAVEAAFTVRLSAPWHEDVWFDYAAVSGTASDLDFELDTGSGLIAAGDTESEIIVRILADSEAEDDEVFEVQLHNPVAASIRPGGGQGTILETARLLTFLEHHRDGEVGVDGLLGAIDMALSPGGEHLYVVGRGDDALTVFARHAGTGRLTLVATYRDGVDGLENLRGFEAVAVSPSGERVYAAAFDDGALASFRRNPVNGTLSLLEVKRQGGRDLESGETIEGLAGAIAIEVVEDQAGGEHLYVAGSESDALAVFRLDPISGLLNFQQVQRQSDPGNDGLRRAVDLALAPEGTQLYVVSLEDDAVTVFDRDSLTGHLTFVESQTDGGGINGLSGAAAVAVAPDGNNVYIAGQADHGLAVFDRAADGRLSFRQAVLNAGDVHGLALTTDVVVSRDGLYVYASGFGDDAVAVFRRAPDGSLTFLEAELDGVAGVDGLNGVTALTVTGEDSHVYVTGTLDNAVAVFRRDLVAPTGPQSLLSSSHEVGVYSSLTSIDLEWSGARDDETGAGVAGYWLLLDDVPDTVPNMVSPSLFVAHSLDSHSVTSGGQPDGDRWAHLLTCDHANNCAVTHAGPFRIDATAPTLPSLISSPSHGPSSWSNRSSIEIEWSQTLDLSGVAGYSLIFDTQATTLPDESIEIPHLADPHAVASQPLAGGQEHYFHLRACDVVGNCGAAVALGPYWIDTQAPDSIVHLRSTSHPTDDTSALQVIDLEWDASADALSGVSGYAVEFSEDPVWTCDQVPDVAPDTLGTSSPLLADGTWYAHVCAGDQAGNWTPVAAVGPFAISTAVATVTLVTTVADTGDGQLIEGEEIRIPVTQLYVDFSRQMRNPSGDTTGVDVTNPGSYLLVASGNDGVVDSTGCPGGADPADDRIIIDHVDYASTPRRATLWIDGGKSLPASRYRLFACADGLHDELDVALDGDSDGASGGDFSRDFRVLVSNELLNPNFDLDLASWLLVSPSPADFDHGVLDADGLVTSGSARLSNTTGATEEPFAVAQCVAVTQTDLAIGGRLRLGSPEASDLVIFGQAEFFNSGNCTGLGTRQATRPATIDASGSWFQLAAQLHAPESASSALVSFVVDSASEMDFEVFFDILFFGDSDHLFGNGFESGDLSGWSSQSP